MRVSRSKPTQESLHASEERFRNLVETTSDWVWEVDEGCVYTYASPRVRDILGYDPHEILGKKPFDLMPPAEAARVAGIFKPIAAARVPFHALENVNLHRDGSLVVLETNGVPFFDSGGEFRGYRGIDRDITERKRQTDDLVHGLNNLLTIITGYSQLAQSRIQPHEPLAKEIHEIKQAADRAASLLPQLVAASRKRAAGPESPARTTILLVDDDPAVLRMVHRALYEHGYDVVQASSAEEALRLSGTREDAIHLLVTDVTMTGLSGNQLAQRLMAARENLRVLYISGCTGDAFALQPGAGFLAKPFTAEALIRKVREALS